MDNDIINIVCQPYRRFEFSHFNLEILKHVKDRFHLTLCAPTRLPWILEDIIKISEKANSLGIPNTVLRVNTHVENNYTNKLKAAVEMPYTYSLKLDEDIFMSPNIYNFIYDNRTLLDDDKNFILTPALSNGIPTCEHFIESQFNQEQKNIIYNIFGSTDIPNIWGADYSCLRSTLKNPYNKNDFYNAVGRVNHHYKGIHPIRVNKNAQDVLNNFIIENIGKFHDKLNYEITTITEPYFCNSVFLIKTEVWKTFLHNDSLYVDSFDEVPLNRHWKNTGKNLLCIKNSFAIHTMYNTLGEFCGDNELRKFEYEFFNRLVGAVGSI